MIEQGKCGGCRWFVPERETRVEEGSIVSDITAIEAERSGAVGGGVEPVYGHCTVYGPALYLGKMSIWPCTAWDESGPIKVYLFEPK